MIDVGICQKNACDWSVAWRVRMWLQGSLAFNLPGQIRRSVNQEPAPKVFGIAADSDARLCLRRNFSRARGDTICTGTVPLRQAAAGCAAENVDANQPGVFAVAMLLD